MRETLGIILMVVSALFIALLVHVTIRRARLLSRRIDEFREEKETPQQPGPVDPYADLADALRTDKEPEDKR